MKIEQKEGRRKDTPEYLLRPESPEEQRFLTILRDLQNLQPRLFLQIAGHQSGTDKAGLPKNPVTVLKLRTALPKAVLQQPEKTPGETNPALPPAHRPKAKPAKPNPPGRSSGLQETVRTLRRPPRKIPKRNQ